MINKGKYINIDYPFKESDKGFFLNLNKDDKNAIKSDLMHLILTRKGERLYMPEFGTNLLKYIFEPNDSITQSSIKEEINDTVKRYIPNLRVNNIIITENPQSEHGVKVQIDYSVTNDVFEDSDIIIIEL